MNEMRLQRISFHILLLLVLFLECSCGTWALVDKHSFQASLSSRRIRIQLVDGTFVETSNYEVRNDTLIVIRQKTPFYAANDLLIPFENIKEIKIDKADPKKSAALAVAFTAIIVTIFIYANSFTKALSTDGT